MRTNAIAIDIGSLNTAIYQAGAGIVLFEPSVVALDVSGKRKIKAVGEEAKRLIGKTAGKSAICFPIVEGLSTTSIAPNGQAFTQLPKPRHP